MRGLLAGLALIAQISDEAILLQDYYRAQAGSPTHIITLIARYPDGMPVRGHISCSGLWFKHFDTGEEESHLSGEGLPFKTDARGAVVLNPHKDDMLMVCRAFDRKGRSGEKVVYLYEKPSVVEIRVD